MKFSLLLALVTSVHAVKEVGTICIRNAAPFILTWDAADLDGGGKSARTANVLAGQTQCMDLGEVDGVVDGHIVLATVHVKAGKTNNVTEQVRYSASSPNKAVFRCQGTTLSYSCDYDSPCPDSLPTDDERRSDLHQCDRECRWQFGFNDRSIIGQRRAWAGVADGSGNACCCYQSTSSSVLNYGSLIDRTSEKAFDTDDTWSGTDATGFDSPWACVRADNGGVKTMDKAQARQQGMEIIHCGKCAVCSGMDDVVVLATTRKWITYVTTKVSTKFAAPWGHKNVTLLEQDLFDLGVNFSLGSGADDEPSCMKCWSDNIMCDAVQCVDKCWTKFFDPTPTDACLQCDERTCGPEFIKCAGANRRSDGIVSDIPRPDREQCTDGYYFGVADEALPSVAKPTDDEIEEVCKRNAGDGPALV